MMNLIRSFVFAFALIQVAATGAQAEARLPATLTCKKTYCIVDTTLSRCNDSAYQTIVLERLNSAAPVWKGYMQGHIDFEGEKIVVDFGNAHDGGNQYLDITFQASDLYDLAEGKRGQVNAMLENGYDWTDGYHTRAQIAYSCK